jgi:hypothetical protein
MRSPSNPAGAGVSEAEERYQKAQSLRILGNGEYQKKQYDTASNHLQESLSIYNNLGDKSRAAIVASSLGEAKAEARVAQLREVGRSLGRLAALVLGVLLLELFLKRRFG